MWPECKILVPFLVTAVLGKMYGSSAINNIKFKCGICSMPHAISGVERTVQGNSKIILQKWYYGIER